MEKYWVFEFYVFKQFESEDHPDTSIRPKAICNTFYLGVRFREHSQYLKTTHGGGDKTILTETVKLPF